MDISVVYVRTAVAALEPALDADGLSRRACIKLTLSVISDALDNGYECPKSLDMIPVDIRTADGTLLEIWAGVSNRSESSFDITVPDPRKDGGVLKLVAQATANRKVWKIMHLELCK